MLSTGPAVDLPLKKALGEGSIYAGQKSYHRAATAQLLARAIWRNAWLPARSSS